VLLGHYKEQFMHENVVTEVDVNGSAEEAVDTDCEHVEKRQLRVIYGSHPRIC
jgi:hypothetical protein